ncbi:MAG: hypothetical protein NC923_03950 [Candidatus Omnitrophica bacterium]|nr:hypothetical protein [Candidatus Omnitrophota bacterium]
MFTLVNANNQILEKHDSCRENRLLLILLAGVFLIFAQTLAQVEVEYIGKEALKELPSSSLWSSAVNFRPGDGEEVDLNPPRFSWSYTPDPRDINPCPSGSLCMAVSPKQFIFQVADEREKLEAARRLNNPLSANLTVNVRTSFNFFNTLPPFDRTKTFYWQVGYIKPKDAEPGQPIHQYWRLRDEDWEKTASGDPIVYVWSDIRSFTIKHDPADPENPEKNALIWDRSMLTDEPALNRRYRDYLAKRGRHPYMLFNNERWLNNPGVTTREALYRFLRQLEVGLSSGNLRSELYSYGRGWKDAKKMAADSIAAPWWYLVSYWKFDKKEAAGLDSWQDNPAFLNGDTFITDINSPAGLYFDGYDDYLTFGSGISTSNDFTLLGWVKLDSVPDTDMVFWSSSDGQQRLMIRPSGGIALQVNAETLTRMSTAANAGRWIFLSLVREGATLKVYRDASLVGSVEVGDTPITVASSILGKGDSCAYFKGLMDNLRLYNRALFSSELDSIRRGIEAATADMLGSWAFDDWSDPGRDYQRSNPVILNGNPASVSGGKSATGVFFPGNSGYVSLNPKLPTLNNFTLSAWIKLDNSVQSAAPFWTSRDGRHQILVHTNAISVRFNDVTYPYISTAHNNGQWIYLALTKNDTSLQVYRNAELIGAFNVSGSAEVNFSESVLGKADGIAYFKGIMDEVCLYRQALTQSQLQGLYQNWRPAPFWEGYRGNIIATVAFVWQMVKDHPEELNPNNPTQSLCDAIDAAEPEQALLAMARYYIEDGGPAKDQILDQKYKEIRPALAFGYDWLYERFNPEDSASLSQRNEILRALELTAIYALKGGLFFSSGVNGASYDITGTYGPYFTVSKGSLAKQSAPHPIDMFHSMMIPALAAYADNQDCRKLFDLGINYMLGVTYPWGFGGATNSGRHYGEVNLFGAALPAHLIYQMSFSEARFNLNPFWQINADWWTRMLPPAFVEGKGSWGHLKGTMNQFSGRSYRDLGYFTGNGKVFKQWREAVERYYSYSAESYYSLPVPFYFSAMTPEDANEPLSRLFLEDGWVIGSTYPSNSYPSALNPTEKSAFKDGVGFVFQARPSGCISNAYSLFSDLSFQLWAYGTVITDTGTNKISRGYGLSAISHNTLLINGRGTFQNANRPSEPYYSRIFAYKQHDETVTVPKYTYVAADATKAYPRLLNSWCGFNSEPMDYVSKVHRHLLFMRHKYFVIFDDLATRQPARFTWLYHVPPLYHINTQKPVSPWSDLREEPSATMNEVIQIDPITELDRTNVVFKYRSNRILPDSRPPTRINPVSGIREVEEVSDVPVIVAHIAEPHNLEIIDRVGHEVGINPFSFTATQYHGTTEDYSNEIVPYKVFNTHHALWISNRQDDLRESFNFMTVIYPYEPGTNAPTIRRIDDYTAEIISGDGSERDVVQFKTRGKAQHPLATIVVDVAELDSVTSVIGDISGDGKINAYDAALAALMVLGMNMSGFNLPQDYQAMADVDGVAGVTLADAALIAQRAVGLITGFPTEGS